MLIEDWIAWLLSVLLSFTGVPCVADGSAVYVQSLNHRFVVILSCVDLVGIGLWTFIFTFVVWVYTSLNNLSISRRKYTLVGFLGYTVFFLANIFRMFIEILYVANAGGDYIIYVSRWQAFEEQVGIGIMLATFTTLFLGFYFVFRRQKPHCVGVIDGKR
ncbi:MAG: hypothetical protein QXH20_00025 [Candidatus Bathyarchaeia archaeon]